MPGESWQDFFANIARDTLRIKIGPGVLGAIVPIDIVGLLAILGIGGMLTVWGQPLLAIATTVLLILFLVYVNERAFRYAEKNPIPALMSGGQIARLIRDQMSAKDRSLIIDEPPIVATSAKTIEAKDGSDA